jgi:preprotein translocase subunit SecG
VKGTIVMQSFVLWGIWSWAAPLLNLAIFFVSLFLILVVLIQRGKGGGLAGAFGGAGGSSAFGTRAGDAFTRFTLIVAAIWLLLIMILVKVAPLRNPPAEPQPEISNPEARLVAPLEPGRTRAA